MAERLGERLLDPASQRRLQRILAQRRIVEDAIVRPDSSADLALFDALARGEGPLANVNPISENSPFLEVAMDIAGDLPYGPFFGGLSDLRSRLSQSRFGAATVHALQPRWQAYADGLSSPRRTYELNAMATILRELGDLDGATSAVRDAERLATGTANRSVTFGWLGLGRLNDALRTARMLPEADPILFIRLADALLNQSTQMDAAASLARDSLPVIYRAGANTDFAQVRDAIKIVAGAGQQDEARRMVQVGANFARVNTIGDQKWRALIKMAAASIDIGDNDTARALLADIVQQPAPEIFPTWAVNAAAAQCYRLGDMTAFRAVRDLVPPDGQWDVWFEVLKEVPVPEDAVAFVRDISQGLATEQRFNRHLMVGRRLAEDGRKEDASRVLHMALDIADSDRSQIKCDVLGMAAGGAINAGDPGLAVRAVRMAVGSAINQPAPQACLSHVLAIWRDQLTPDNGLAK